MKKWSLLLLAVAAVLIFASCGEQSAQELPAVGSASVSASPEPDIVTVADIIDRTQTEPLGTADALEGFWRDEEHTYCFPSIKSHYIIVHYSDGTRLPIREAMERGDVTIADLDRFGIDYYKGPRQ